MTKLYHRGAPCDPPNVNGIEFSQDAENPEFFSAEVADASIFAGIDSFVDDPLKSPVPTPAVSHTSSDDSLEVATIHAQNTALQARIVDFQARVSTLEIENNELRLALDEANAALSAEQDDDVADDDKAQITAEIEALETKKSLEGKLSPAENMKLGKLNKRLAAMS
jgi:regulator of replication initiation timing